MIKLTGLQKLTGAIVVLQAILWAILFIIFFVTLPNHGFSGLEDFNDPIKVSSAPTAMAFIVWSDLVFGLAMLYSVCVLYPYLRARMPLALSGGITILLIGAVAWFIAHDIGFHLLGFESIQRDPASTNYAMDRLLWGFRNGVFYAFGLLIFMVVRSDNRDRPAGASGQVNKSPEDRKIPDAPRNV